MSHDPQFLKRIGMAEWGGPEAHPDSNRLWDVLVLGGGPGGCAVASKCAEAGLKVAVIENKRFPRERMGETFHPNVENLLKQLGVDSPSNISPLQRSYPTNWILKGWNHRFESVTADPLEVNAGFQPFFGSVDLDLYRRAKDVGVRFFVPYQAIEPLVQVGRVAGVLTNKGPIRCRFLVDAGGGKHWLASHLKLRILPSSPVLTAFTGYAEGSRDSSGDKLPRTCIDSAGWTWLAQVGPHLYKWNRVTSTSRQLDQSWSPPEFKGLVLRGLRYQSDVTWRNVNQPAGPGYFLIGDAAAVLDPAASQGVVKALMGALLAAHFIPKILKNEIPESQAVEVFSRSLTSWFRHEVECLRLVYALYPQWGISPKKPGMVGVGF